MGYGDDLLVTALAANLKKKFPYRQIVIGNFEKKQAYHSIVYDNNPNISDCRNIDKKKEIHIVDYHPENRPYINYEKSTSKKYIWNNKFKASPGELYFTTNEIKVAEAIIDDAKLFWKKNNTKEFNGIIFLETSSTKVDHKNWSMKQINKGKDPTEILGEMSKSLTNKLIHSPTSAIRQASRAGRREIISNLKEIYEISDLNTAKRNEVSKKTTKE